MNTTMTKISNTTPLYEMVIVYNELLEKYNRAETEDDIQRLEIELNNISSSIQQKSSHIATSIKNSEEHLLIIDMEIERLKMRKQKIQKFQEWAKKYLGNMLRAANILRMELPLITISFRKSSRVEIINADIIPKEYLRTRTITEPDKIAIKDAWKEGTEVAGTKITEEEHLQIK